MLHRSWLGRKGLLHLLDLYIWHLTVLTCHFIIFQSVNWDVLNQLRKNNTVSWTYCSNSRNVLSYVISSCTCPTFLHSTLVSNHRMESLATCSRCFQRRREVGVSETRFEQRKYSLSQKKNSYKSELNFKLNFFKMGYNSQFVSIVLNRAKQFITIKNET
jgi:hypothetical protein